MSGHKIGDWSVDGHNLASVIRKTDTGWEIVSICPNANSTWRADARLQAAAPEMLAELRRLANEGDLHFDDRMSVLAIIAKAEGRQP